MASKRHRATRNGPYSVARGDISDARREGTCRQSR